MEEIDTRSQSDGGAIQKNPELDQMNNTFSKQSRRTTSD